jgi:predicted Zn-dependent peptidase
MKDPGFAAKDLERYRTATKERVRDTAATYLVPDRRVIVRVVPPAAKRGKK